MSETWVMNASPVILFARIGRLDIIEQLAKTIVVPIAVIGEIRAGEQDDPSAKLAIEFAELHRDEAGLYTWTYFLLLRG